MKSSAELNSLLLKFFCYVNWFNDRRHWKLYKGGLIVKFYCFFERITYSGLKTANCMLYVKLSGKDAKLCPIPQNFNGKGNKFANKDRKVEKHLHF